MFFSFGMLTKNSIFLVQNKSLTWCLLVWESENWSCAVKKAKKVNRFSSKLILKYYRVEDHLQCTGQIWCTFFWIAERIHNSQHFCGVIGSFRMSNAAVRIIEWGVIHIDINIYCTRAINLSNSDSTMYCNCSYRRGF